MDIRNFYHKAATLMHKYEAHCATDITGFGLLGHAKNLAEFQNDTVVFKINKLPIIKNVLAFGQLTGQEPTLVAGRSVETSGGLLICMSPSAADLFCKEFKLLTSGHQEAFVIGHVEEANQANAVLSDVVNYIEVDLSMENVK